MEFLLSFAQLREDIVLYHLLKKVDGPIRYVDVGARDPIIGSVTKFFYDRGAHGINIEPLHDPINRLNEDRPRDINLEVGISDKAGELTLYGASAYASFDPNNQLINQKVTHTVPVVSLTDVFNKYVRRDEDIHFLKIDVEGWEGKCLEGMDFIRFRPWILCIEAVPPYGYGHENWEGLLLGQNYVYLGDDTANRYYAAAEKLQVIQEFRRPEELDSIYTIIPLSPRYMLDESIISMLQRQKVVLFGASDVGQSYWRQIQDTGLPLTAWIASWPQEGFPVDTLESLDKLEYDVIFIAIREASTAEEIQKILIEKGVPREKIIWRSPVVEKFF